MSLEKKVMTDLKAAMKAKDKARMRTIRAIKSQIILAKTDGSGTDLDEAKEIAMLQKMAKQRKESLELYEKQGREDLAANEREEIAVIESYLPKQMDEAELEAAVKSIIEETGASSMKDMGKVMGMANQRFKGRADGRTISGVVKRMLA